MIKAAGILLLTKDNRVLLLLRAAGSDHAGEWSFPGGKIEDGETPEQAAVRESVEEIGKCPDGKRAELVKICREGVEFTTFVQRIPEPFDLKLDEVENSAYVWSPVEELPLGMHPGAVIAIKRLMGNEFDIAKMMAVGDIPSPQKYENLWLFDVRITGTGTAYRKELDEFVYRRPENYLTQYFLDRCNGLAVIMEHPDKFLMNSKEFMDRVIGAICLPYIKGDEVWGIAKIHDGTAAEIMVKEKLSTSPAVYFRDNTNSTLTLDDGSKLLIEGKPSLLDHLAMCSLGVWDKGGPPSGVNYGDSMMTDEEKKALEAKAKADSEAAEQERMDRARKDSEDNDRWDKVFGALDSMSKRMDSMEECAGGTKKADSDEEAKKAEETKKKAEEGKKADSDEEAKKAEETKKKADSDEAKKKADDDEEVARADSDRRHAETQKRIQDLEARIPARPSDADFAALSSIQARADSVAQAFCDSAPRPMDGETPLAYRRRMLKKFQKHSDTWSKVNLDRVGADLLDVAEPQIYADSMKVARNPTDLQEGELRPIVTSDDTGRRITSFTGEPRSWMNDFAGHRRVLTGITKAPAH